MKPKIIKPNLDIDLQRLSKLTRKDFVGIHHTYVEHNQTVQTIHNYHKNTMHWAGIGYHFYIEQDGKTYEGRPLDVRGAHIKGENNRSIGVCLAGNFDTQNLFKTFPEQYNSLIKLLVWLINEYPEIKIKRHTDFDLKSCPGEKFPWEKMKKDVRKFKEVDDVLSKYFNDMTESHEWGSDHVDELYEEDLISGIDDSNFAPDRNITRLEVAVLINRLRMYMLDRL